MKDMEYICVDCVNNETVKKKRTNNSIEPNSTYKDQFSKTWTKYESEIKGFKERVESQKKRVLYESPEKSAPIKVEPYIIYGK